MRVHEKLLSLVVVGTAASAVFVIACGGSSGGGDSGPGAVSSVDSTKKVNGLSDTEAKQYCEDANRYQAAQLTKADTKKISCGFTAQAFAAYGAETDADAQAKCQQAYSECMNRPDDTTEVDAGGATDSCAAFAARSKACNATVGEVNQCLSDEAALLKTLAAKDFCAEAKAASADAGSDPSSSLTPPASCQTLEKTCPNVAESSDGRGTDG